MPPMAWRFYPGSSPRPRCDRYAPRQTICSPVHLNLAQKSGFYKTLSLTSCHSELKNCLQYFLCCTRRPSQSNVQLFLNETLRTANYGYDRCRARPAARALRRRGCEEPATAGRSSQAFRWPFVDLSCTGLHDCNRCLSLPFTHDRPFTDTFHGLSTFHGPFTDLSLPAAVQLDARLDGAPIVRMVEPFVDLSAALRDQVQPCFAQTFHCQGD